MASRSSAAQQAAQVSTDAGFPGKRGTLFYPSHENHSQIRHSRASGNPLGDVDPRFRGAALWAIFIFGFEPCPKYNLP